MTTVSAGATGTYTFTATQTVTITLDPSERAMVTVTRAGVVVFSGSVGSSQTIGPFLAADVMAITAQRTAIDYTVNAYSTALPVSGGAMGVSADTPTASASNRGQLYVKTDAATGTTPFMSNGVSFVQIGAGTNAEAGLTSAAFADRGTATLNLIKNLTDAGANGTALWVGDGTNYRALNGHTVLGRRNGSVASPVATYTGGTGGVFTNGQIVLPANAIAPHSTIRGVVFVKRTGANATANIRVFLGTAGTTSDSVLGQLQLSGTDGHVGKLTCEGLFGTATNSFVSSGALAAMNSAGTSTFADQNTNIATGSAMTISVAMTNANAADSFALVGYVFWMEH